MAFTVFPQTLLAIWPYRITKCFGALKVTSLGRSDRWKCIDSCGIPLQVTRNVAICGVPAPSDQKHRYLL